MEEYTINVESFAYLSKKPEVNHSTSKTVVHLRDNFHQTVFIMSNLDAPVNNTPYEKEDLQHFKQKLEELQQETEEEITTLRESLDNLTSNQEDESSAAAHHQGDIASEEDEREKFLIMIGKQQDKLDEITAALDRIELGTYGVCEDTGDKIQKERLEAIPYARYSVDARRKDEQTNAPQ